MLKTSLLSGLMQHMNQPCWSVLMSSCPLTSPFIKKSKVCLGIGCPELYHSQNYYVNCSCLQNCSVITTSNLGARIISCVFFFFFFPQRTSMSCYLLGSWKSQAHSSIIYQYVMLVKERCHPTLYRRIQVQIGKSIGKSRICLGNI